MPTSTIDRAQLHALKVLRRAFGRDQVHVIDVRDEPPGATTPPRKPPTCPKGR
jgi:hypothetical protein